MESKKLKWLVAAIIVIGILGWTGWQLFKPKPKESFTQKEISIKQAEIPQVTTLTYSDWAGFKFEYPSVLAVKEIELDNPSVYSSLELTNSDNKKMTVRIADTVYPDLAAWQKAFAQDNSVRKIDQTTLAEMPGLKLQYGAPEMILTVAINDGILYQVQSTADSGFWTRTHTDLVDSFTLTNTQAAEPSARPAQEDGAITLVEETVK